MSLLLSIFSGNAKHSSSEQPALDGARDGDTGDTNSVNNDKENMPTESVGVDSTTTTTIQDPPVAEKRGPQFLKKPPQDDDITVASQKSDMGKLDFVDEESLPEVAPVTPTPQASRKRPTEANSTPKKANRSAAKKAKRKEIVKAAATRQPPVRPGSRVKCRRSQVFHCLTPELQKYLPRTDPNFHNYYGTVVRKNKKGKVQGGNKDIASGDGNKEEEDEATVIDTDDERLESRFSPMVISDSTLTCGTLRQKHNTAQCAMHFPVMPCSASTLGFEDGVHH